MQGLSTIRSILLRYGLALLSVAVVMVLRDDVSPIVGGLAGLLATVPAAVTAIVSLAAGWYFPAPIYPLRSHLRTVHEATSLVVCVSAFLLSAAYRVELRRREAKDRELRHERDALDEAEEKFRAVAEICSGAILIHDGRRLLYMNRASEELFGYTRDEGLACDMCQIVHPDYRKLVRKCVAARLH